MTSLEAPPRKTTHGPHPKRDRLSWVYGGLFIGSIVDSSLLPWPMEFPLTAVMLRGRAHVFPAAIVVWAGSVIGCLAMYVLGAFAFELATSMLDGRVGWFDGVAGARAAVDDRAAWAVFGAMFTPGPQIATFAAGAAGVSFGAVLAACCIGRALRFGSMAVLVFIFGERIIAWWRAQSRWLRIGVIVLASAAFVALLVYQVFG